MAQMTKFSIIVPLYKKGYETLDTFLQHLKEQDYKNYEVLFVYNSPDNEAKEAVAKMGKQLKGITYRELDAGYQPKLKAGNHCRAFNAGAEQADGDYLLFLDPDVYLYPGVLREYKDAFEQNPDVQFVYGDYDFMNGAGRVAGRPYNEYELRCANYISGGFPIRKEAFRGWDEHLESLQDWDMWLTAVDAGAKGLYIGRPCFQTELPTEDGISANQAKNWLERYNQVRNKHNFPVSKTAVTSLGAPLHATNAAKLLGADTRVISNIWNFKPHEYDNLYVLGFYPLAWQAHLTLFYHLGKIKDGTIVGKNRIIHWIGTDIYQMQHKLSWVAWQNMLKILNSEDLGFIHLAEDPYTQKELEELGITAAVVPLPPAELFEPMPLPKKFTVGVYINPTQDMYNENFMYAIAEAMPDIDFKFFGNPHMTDKKEGNKEWVGWVKMEEFLPTISAIVRLTVHDGLPHTPLQAITAGRNVLASFPLKHALHAEYVGGEPDRADVVKKIRQMKKMPINTEGAAYWRQELAPELYKERMARYLG